MPNILLEIVAVELPLEEALRTFLPAILAENFLRLNPQVEETLRVDLNRLPVGLSSSAEKAAQDPKLWCSAVETFVSSPVGGEPRSRCYTQGDLAGGPALILAFRELKNFFQRNT